MAEYNMKKMNLVEVPVDEKKIKHITKKATEDIARGSTGEFDSTMAATKKLFVQQKP